MARPSKRSLNSSRGAEKEAAARSREKPAPLPEMVSSWTDFYRVVRRIPRGRVCTYGAVAAMASHPRSARHVGFALAALKETGKNADVPWQRVLGSKGKSRAVITIKDPVGGAVQRMLLEAEGVEFDKFGSVSLERFGWFQGEKKKGAKKKPGPKPSPAKTTAKSK
jgi:methylated-DNA-protein-cysteine methyltransferase-like protein